MSDTIRSTIVEIQKLKRCPIVWIVFLAFALLPIMGGVLMYLLQHPSILPSSSILAVKTSLLTIPVAWETFLTLFIIQGSSIVGILGFGFIGSYLFGREYSDYTYRDLLSLPISRTVILNSKYIVYALWCYILSLANLLLSFIIGILLNLPEWRTELLLPFLSKYFVVTSMVLLNGIPVSFFALWARGYLAPLGFLVTMLLFANFAPYVGIGQYFPWSIPMLYAGMAGEEFVHYLNFGSVFIILITAFIGYCLSVYWWCYRDQL